MRKFLVSIVLSSLVVGCSSLRVIEHNEKETNLAEYEFFAWGDNALDQSTQSSLAIADTTIRASLNNELQRKGYEVVNDGAQITMTWRVGRSEVEVFEEPVYTIDNSLGDNMQASIVHDGQVFQSSSEFVSVDQLVILFADTATQEPLYAIEIRGVHENAATTEGLKARIEEALKKAYKSIPRRR
ncbi:DUF4136 domain-containing protein [Umboniibacter marinipuniceus]|uniref:Uncharacterized protein DUF4136 n=1 Tax=Umboniibacter marinipuniceus TaxID=569599 RepID=A0A3M0A3D6_9GAMM|nr:DUF4136 domain-containing protein [Umboniibacter marinipuniceus]RMA79340.1 uncharacterized protein DUF4136 [Umboniibacter marinipuniceus]